jgi:hypothetical protein
MKRYYELSKELLSADGNWKVIGKQDVADFKGKLLQVIQKSPSMPHMI